MCRQLFGLVNFYFVYWRRANPITDPVRELIELLMRDNLIVYIGEFFF